MKRAALAWLAIVVPVWLVLVLCTHWEPVLRDGWGHVIRHKTADVISFDYLWDFVKGTYLENNPRIGQTFTLLQYTPGPWHVIITPFLELGLFFVLTALVLGRWPSLRRTEDALLCATIIAMVFATARSLGPMLFYRPFTGNYLFGLVVSLLWLVPYRFHGEEPRSRRWWWSPIMMLAGVAAGLCNEHTGPTFAAAGVLAVILFLRRGERFVPWALAGLVGMFAGSAMLFLAPGQDVRYAGLATQQSTWELIVERGANDNAYIVMLFAAYIVPLVAWLALGVVARLRKASVPQPRARRVAELILFAMAVLIVLTLLASPKQGDRLYFAPVCLASAGVAGWVIAQLGRPERWIAVGLATVVIAWVSWRLVTVYHQAGREFDARFAAIKSAAPASTLKVPPFTVKKSRYFLGDDFVGAPVRGAVAFAYGLTAIELEP
jgi:hypothetical protein